MYGSHDSTTHTFLLHIVLSPDSTIVVSGDAVTSEPCEEKTTKRPPIDVAFFAEFFANSAFFVPGCAPQPGPTLVSLG